MSDCQKDIALVLESNEMSSDFVAEEPPQSAEDCLVEEKQPNKASARATTMNFITGGLGSAIFSLPWSMAGSSIIPSLVLVAIVLFLNWWTISIIVRACDRFDVFDLGSLARRLPRIGRPMQVVINIFVNFSMFLCLVSYLIVMHDSGVSFFQSHHDKQHAGPVHIPRIIPVSIAALVVLPLCFLSMQLLEKTSSIAIGINIYLFVLVGVFYVKASKNHDLPDDCCLLGATVKGNFAMATVLFQAVIVQMCAPPMYKQLEDRSPQKFDRIVAISFCVLFVLFSGFSTICYLLIGPQVSSNVLEDLPHNIGSLIAQGGVILVVACVFPIMVIPMIEPLETMQIRVLDSSKTRNTFIALVKVFIVAASWLVSVFVRSLGIVNVINGAMSAGVFVALVPSAIGFFLLDTGKCYKATLFLLLIIGLGMAGAGFVFSDNYVDELKCSITL